MSRFIVFDVETPNRFNNRMSAVGITVIQDGIITDGFYSLVNPETSFDYFNTQLTGISEETVADAPSWELRDYNIEWKPYVRYLCTVQMGRKLLPDISHKLNVLCDYYHIGLDHHQAASDSHACAEILLHYLDNGADLRQHIRTYSLHRPEYRNPFYF